jgi:hypothetical protein
MLASCGSLLPGLAAVSWLGLLHFEAPDVDSKHRWRLHLLLIPLLPLLLLLLFLFSKVSSH